MRLRDYQIEARDAVLRQLMSHKSTLVEMATGLGKTVMFAHIANEWPGRVLVLAHRDELIRQAHDKLVKVIHGDDPVCRYGDENWPAIEMGRERAEDTGYGSKITVASIQTLARANR